MFATCASATGRAISEGLAPCPMDGLKAFDFESFGYDTDKLQAKLQAFDSWLWNDCDGNRGIDLYEPALQVDCIQRSLSLDVDPPLFQGGRNRLSIECHPHYIAANRAALANGNSSEVSPIKVENQDNATKMNCEKDVEIKQTRSPLREVPNDFDLQRLLNNHNGDQDDIMQDRAEEMKRAMNRRSVGMKDEWAKGAKKLKAWLVNNNFFGIDTKRRSLFGFSYPLHIAAGQNNIEVVQLLILRQADASQLDSSGKTALQVAAKKCKNGSHRKVVEALTAVS